MIPWTKSGHFTLITYTLTVFFSKSHFILYGLSHSDTDQGEDDALNEMMASSVAELQLYQTLDATYIAERTARWEQLGWNPDTTPLPPRLMESHELPRWLTNDCWPTKYQTIMGDMMNISTQVRLVCG
jgi:hypothetical protein